jgi:uncharacterized UPF0160 family protein
MKTNALSGIAYHFFPSYTNDTTDKDIIEDALDRTFSNCEIHFFIGSDAVANGGMPETLGENKDGLFYFNTISQVTDEYKDMLAFSITDIDLKLTYDKVNHRRIIKKWPVDAVEYESTKTGALAWAAIKLTADDAIIGDTIIFVDGITPWDEENTIILVDSLDVTSGESVLVKDVTISLKDVFEVQSSNNN